MVVIPSATKAGLKNVVNASIDHPHILARDECFAIGLESLKQGGPRGVFVFTEKVNGFDIRLSIHVGLAGEDKDRNRFGMNACRRGDKNQRENKSFIHIA